MSKTHQKSAIQKYMIYGFNNSRFDNLFIFEELKRRNPSLDYIITDNAIKSITYFNITILDVSLYYAGSLSSVSESFKLKISKGVFPYKFPNKDNLKD